MFKKVNKYKILRYSILRKIIPGVKLSIVLSWRCSLKCPYCSQKLGGNKMPNDPELKTVNEWIDYIKNFPLKIKEIQLTGGEPSIYPGIVELANKLLEEGYLLTIYSNLTNTKLLDVNPTRRLRIKSTYHESHDQDRFKNNLDILRKIHRVDIDEIDHEVIGNSNIKQWCTIEEIRKSIKGYLRIAPNGTIYTNCYDCAKEHLC
jgi:organic radical activating enzyme